MKRLVSAALGFAMVLISCGFSEDKVSAADRLPSGFVHLRAVDPTIAQAIRYAGPLNFTGKKVAGYDAAECILAEPVAHALARVQSALKSGGLGLKVFDCYRPARAVAAFVRWAQTADNDRELKQRYFPRTSKGELMPAYIARRSGHSRGGSVDLTIVKLPDGANAGFRDGCGPHSGEGAEIDMATGFDCFDSLSRTAATGIPADARAGRDLLVRVMREHGFRNYAGEWWHFTYRDEPFPNTYFDFSVAKAPATDD